MNMTSHVVGVVAILKQTVASFRNGEGMATAERRLQALLGHLRPDSGPLSAAAVAGVSAYRYTVSGNGVLSEEQRAAFERDGFVVVPGLVSVDELQTYTERFKELCKGTIKTPGLTIMKDVSIAKSEYKKDERAITKIQDFQVDIATTTVNGVVYHPLLIAV